MDDARRRANARAARALPIKLVMVSKGGGKAMDSACKEWSDKLSRYAPFAEIVVKTNPKNAKDPKAQMEAEGERVMKHIDARDYVVLMDERGKDITSEAMAKLLADAGDAGHGGIVFAVGGPSATDQTSRAARTPKCASAPWS